MTTAPAEPRVASRAEWLEARKALLAREKELTRMHDRVAEERRALPWVRVEKEYVFDGPDGRVSLADLFEHRPQLMVYHFMFAPGWKEGCDGCSFVADHVDAARQHFEHNNLSFAAVSRAPWTELEPFKRRMGWGFRWVSSAGSDFNYDFGVSFRREDLDRGEVVYNYRSLRLKSEEQPGASVFYRNDAGEIFHTYSCYERGLEVLLGTYAFLDLAPMGRNETGPMSWLRFHDRYDDRPKSCCPQHG